MREAFIAAPGEGRRRSAHAGGDGRFTSVVVDPATDQLRPKSRARAAAATAVHLNVKRDYPIQLIVVPTDAGADSAWGAQRRWRPSSACSRWPTRRRA